MALLTYHNTPDRDTKRSPAQVLYARTLRDAIPCNPAALQLCKEWVLTREAREKALARRHEVRGQEFDAHAHPLHPLQVGAVVQVQNQNGNYPNKWDKSGTIVEVLPFDAYLVKLDGSGRVTKRNRKYLRTITPYSSILMTPPTRPLLSIARVPQNSGGPTSYQGFLKSQTTLPNITVVTSLICIVQDSQLKDPCSSHQESL